MALLCTRWSKGFDGEACGGELHAECVRVCVEERIVSNQLKNCTRTTKKPSERCDGREVRWSAATAARPCTMLLKITPQTENADVIETRSRTSVCQLIDAFSVVMRFMMIMPVRKQVSGHPRGVRLDQTHAGFERCAGIGGEGRPFVHTLTSCRKVRTPCSTAV
jgi:hypothetical protein